MSHKTLPRFKLINQCKVHYFKEGLDLNKVKESDIKRDLQSYYCLDV